MPRGVRAVIVSLVVGSLMVVFAVPAMAFKPFGAGAADVKLSKDVQLNPDGTIVVSARLRCDPAWEPADLTIDVFQEATSGSAVVVPQIPCDDRWHRVNVQVTGSFGPGVTTLSAQFIVHHDVFGDPAGAHDTVVVRL